MDGFLTAAFYKFVDLPDFQQLREPLRAACEERGVKGLILLAPEGVNGTIAGHSEDVHAVLAHLRSGSRLGDLQHKESVSQRAPFHRMKVRLKKEIATVQGTWPQPQPHGRNLRQTRGMECANFRPGRGAYRHPQPLRGRAAPPGAINPHIHTFSDLPAWIARWQAQHQRDTADRDKNPRSPCLPGGIRCEKSTAYMRSLGYDAVYHLEGGILEVPGARARRAQPLAGLMLCVR